MKRSQQLVETRAMRRTRSRYTIPRFIIEIFVLSLFLTIIVDLRDQFRRKTALEAAQVAYRNARDTRETAEAFVTWKIRMETPPLFHIENAARLNHIKNATQLNHIKNATIEELQNEFEHARADELAKMAEYDRLKAIRTRRFR